MKTVWSDCVSIWKKINFNFKVLRKFWCFIFLEFGKRNVMRFSVHENFHMTTESDQSIIKIEIKINRKLRVTTKIGNTFFWCLTSYRAAEIVQNDYFSSA
jgi:hypothetical protein